MNVKKKALVIGGTSGYGAGIASVLEAAGYETMAVGRSSTPWVDVTKPKEISGVLKTMRSVDVVVYSAGIAIGKDFLSDKEPFYLQKVMNVNTVGLMWALHYSFPYLKESRGHFFHVGSIAAYFTYPGGVDYCASKAASNSIMKGIRREWLGTGIRTTSLEVGLGNTNFQARRYDGNKEKAKKHFDGVRMIEPEELGEVVLSVIRLPEHLNMDEIILKPLDQASHGFTVKNIQKQF